MEATGIRFRALFRSGISYSSQLQRLRPFSSSAEVRRRSWRFLSDDSEDGTGSAVYKRALKFQRPSKILWQEQLQNSASFIGTVDLPLKIMNTRNGRLGVYTMLNVKPSRDSNRFLRIFLQMWDKMAEISIKHLKANDFIYVSGHLGSYTKSDENGNLRMRYQVTVEEINYVAQHGQVTTCQKAEQSGSEEPGESTLEKRKNRHHLWQVFFANPHEWWDNRKRKVNSNQPDFRHKGTGEALWLNPKDPPWILRQLQRHDSRLAEKGLEEHQTYGSNVSPLVYDEYWGGI